jgi:hypothetical protein
MIGRQASVLICKYLAFATVAFLASASGLSQVSVEVKKSLLGVTRPEIVGEYIFVGADSNPSVSDVAVVNVDTSWKFQLLKFRRDGVRFTADKLDDSHWIVAGKGKYELAATLFDPDKGIYDEEFAFTLGGTGPTPPPDPQPDPPPPPDIVPNAYNVGSIAYTGRPADAPNSSKLAGVYRQAGQFLYGNPRLMTVQDAANWIRQQFDAKQCIDQATCQQWTVWYNSVNQALAAEQRRRGAFTRDDWYRAWLEVAAALEATK